MSVKIKICGITNLEDALMASEAGADMLGFVFYDKSPRKISLEDAAAISARLPAHVLKVGVFVDPPEDLVRETITACQLNILQFHGQEKPPFYRRFGLLTIKAFRIRSLESLDALSEHSADAFLLDSYHPKQLGGTGEVFNWDLAVMARQRSCPIILAGGLTPQNVAEAVARVQPFGVDVSSGVEASPGRKDPAKTRAFIQAAQNI